MTKKIQRIMRKHNLTQRRIARDLGVTETWVSLVLHRKGKSMRVLREIARRTSSRVEELLPQNRKAA
jgi:transcriptional regulator with XRE-family HTH domain